jgi:hypothetical protein
MALRSLGLVAAACWALVSILAFVPMQARAEEIVPLAGCYERLYDAAWLDAHRGQIVRKLTLSVVKTSAPETPGEKQPILADAMLAMWSGKTAFSTISACYWERVGLVCNAALSAQETARCKSKADGVRACRISFDDSGSFALEQKPEGLMLTIRERLELPGPESQGTYLYLSPGNAENHAFLLKPASAGSCK